MNKKAQGISIDVIIVAAIALIVLVVLIAIFTGRFAIFGQKVAETGKECSAYTFIEGGVTYGGGAWKASCATDEKLVTAVTDANKHPTEVCCLKKQ
jgi:hypothetical protein